MRAMPVHWNSVAWFVRFPNQRAGNSRPKKRVRHGHCVQCHGTPEAVRGQHNSAKGAVPLRQAGGAVMLLPLELASQSAKDTQGAGTLSEAAHSARALQGSRQRAMPMAGGYRAIHSITNGNWNGILWKAAPIPLKPHRGFRATAHLLPAGDLALPPLAPDPVRAVPQPTPVQESGCPSQSGQSHASAGAPPCCPAWPG